MGDETTQHCYKAMIEASVEGFTMQKNMTFLSIALYLILRTMGPGAQGLRLVSTSPQLTEIMFALGKGADLVGTSFWSLYPPKAMSLPSIGAPFFPGIETTALLSPDWVLYDSSISHPMYLRAVQNLGTRYLSIKISTVENLFAESRRILSTVYSETNNIKLSQLQLCANDLKSAPVTSFRYLAFAWFAPPIVFGSTAFLADLIRLLGGINVLPTHISQSYPQVSQEWLANENIDVIYFLEDDPRARQMAQALVNRLWPGKKIGLMGLEPAFFARASFTPLHHLEALNPNLTPPPSCRIIN